MRFRIRFAGLAGSALGALLLALGLVPACSDGNESTTSPTPAADMSGTWDGRFAGAGQGSGVAALEQGVLTLSQADSVVTGTLEFEGHPVILVAGMVDGQVLPLVGQGALADGRDLQVVATGTLISSSRLSGLFEMTVSGATSRGIFDADRR